MLFLAQIQFADLLQIGEYIPRVQEALRREFPLFAHTAMKILAVAPTGVPNLEDREAWNFNAADRRTGIILSRDAMTFVTTQYDTFEETLPRFTGAMEKVQGILEIGVLLRCGLRYIDVIAPNQDSKIEDFVRPEINGIPGESFGVHSLKRNSAFQGESEIGTMVIRFGTSQFPQILPPDLATLTIEPSIQLALGQDIATLDFDHFVEKQMDFSVTNAVMLLSGLHDAIDRAFRYCVTPFAQEAWGRKDA